MTIKGEHVPGTAPQEEVAALVADSPALTSAGAAVRDRNDARCTAQPPLGTHMILGLARDNAAQLRRPSARDRDGVAVVNLSGGLSFTGGQLGERLVPVGTEKASADALYDACRDVYYAKPALRGWLHLLWFGASLVFGTLLLARAHGAAWITAAAVYAASVSSLFGISALYHRGNWTAAWSRRLQRLDHAMIFFLIAGTATPTFLLATRGAFGLACLIVMWALTLTAAAIHLAWMRAPEVVVGATFVGLGWVACLALPGVWIHAGAGPGALMLAGGALYLAGAISYHRRRPDPYPAVFGYHEVFHAYVCAAATCQFIAIALFIS